MKKDFFNTKRFTVVLSAVFLSAFALFFSSCDEHDPLDLDIHPGYILCDDGRVLSPEAFDESSNVPVAVFFAPLTDKHPALAVLLDELSYISFADTLFEQKTSGSVADYDGYLNTIALQSSKLARDSVSQRRSGKRWYCSDLGLSAFCSHYFSQSDYVPSVAELGLLYLSLPVVNPVIERCGGQPVSTVPEYAGCWYWSSTEVAENTPNQAWLFSMADGSRHRTPKTNRYSARLIVEYNPLNIEY